MLQQTHKKGQYFDVIKRTEGALKCSKQHLLFHVLCDYIKLYVIERKKKLTSAFISLSFVYSTTYYCRRYSFKVLNQSVVKT